MDESDAVRAEDTAEALEAYGCDPGPFRGESPTYQIGEDTGWQELADTLYERADAVREEAIGDGDDMTAYELDQLLGRASLDAYEDVVDDDHDRSVTVLHDPDDIRDVHDAVDSCIAGDDARAREFADDPYTIVGAIERDGEELGYLRAFLLEDGAGRPFLGLDALEVPRHEHERYSDVIQAGGLALCHIAAETGVDRVIGRDDRAGYGLRQAFGSRSEDVSFEKPGEPVFSHGFHPETDGTAGYRLWESPERLLDQYWEDER